MEKGRKEGEKKKQLEIARNMKAKGFAAEDISELSSASPSMPVST